MKTIDIVAHEWFDRVNGNSYFSAHITVNWNKPSEANFYLPFQYGYGEQYITETWQVLHKHGYLPGIDPQRFTFWRYCRENNIDLRYRKIENCKKSELQNN